MLGDKLATYETPEECLRLYAHDSAKWAAYTPLTPDKKYLFSDAD